MLKLMKLVKLSPIVLAISLSACGDKPAANVAVTAAVQTPVAAPVQAAAAPAIVKPDAATLAKGEAVFNQTCQACHAAGVLGAPKLGDSAAWGPRVAKGIDTLHGSALNGFKMMPPRGGNAMLKDPEVQAAVDYMVSKIN